MTPGYATSPQKLRCCLCVQKMQNKVIEYRASIHEIFMQHDKDKGGYIEGDEQVGAAAALLATECFIASTSSRSMSPS